MCMCSVGCWLVGFIAHWLHPTVCTGSLLLGQPEEREKEARYKYVRTSVKVRVPTEYIHTHCSRGSLNIHCQVVPVGSDVPGLRRPTAASSQRLIDNVYM